MQPDEFHGGADQSRGGPDSDSDDRVRDFLARHGGRANRRDRAGEIVAGLCGWSEVYAADGYVLRCEWSKIGGRLQMHFIEKPARPESR
ncbi:MAG: hypothetical protein WBF89_13110 [Steroidobacteraceae bacterium]|jgi:hypothetical protein